ncbi:MAG: hypothetical protein JXQ80_13005 [Bacteroidales bacterium]|nr:hypothetical protein [Bacteroidales bacterium]
MRRLFTINFETLLSRMLPEYKRLPKRLLLFYWPFGELTTLFAAFKAWRADVFYRVNVTGQVISLQTYLNRVIEGANGEIRIENFNDLGVWVQLSTEDGESYMIPEYCEAASRGEFTPLTDVDFYVYVPQGVNNANVARIVNQYKLAGKRYLIVTIAVEMIT